MKSIGDGPIATLIARQHFVSSIWLVIAGNQVIQARFSCCVSKSTQLAGPMCLCQCLFFKGEVGCLGVSGVPESSVSSNLRLPRIPHHLLQLPAQVASEEIIVQQSHGLIVYSGSHCAASAELTYGASRRARFVAFD